MSDSLVCPICDTTNEPGATNCEVCGERIAPLAEGEQLSPEENVSAMLNDASGSGMTYDNANEDDDEDAEDGGFFILDDEEDEDSGYATGFTVESSEEIDIVSAQPDALYSPIDGSAYLAGTPEYEEGYGPLGEQLVINKPNIEPPAYSTEILEESSIESGFDIAGEDISEANTFQAYQETLYDEPIYEEADEEPATPKTKSPAIEPMRTTPRQQEVISPLPTPGIHAQPATLTVYQNRQPVESYEVASDELLIGRRDPVANAFPDIDVSQFDPEGQVSRKHAYIYRQHKNYTLYVISNTGTQLNNELLELGQRRPLKDGDVIILAGKLAMKFQIPTE